MKHFISFVNTASTSKPSVSFVTEPLKAGRRNPLQRLPHLMSAKMSGLSKATEVSFTRQTLALDMRH